MELINLIKFSHILTFLPQPCNLCLGIVVIASLFLFFNKVSLSLVHISIGNSDPYLNYDWNPTEKSYNYLRYISSPPEFSFFFKLSNDFFKKFSKIHSLVERFKNIFQKLAH